jgi:hypothetical protein
MFSNHSSSRRRPPGPIKFLFFLGFIALALLVLGNVIMFLWNEILVETTGVQPLNFWKAVGLLLLSRILVGGLRFGGSKRSWSEKRKQYKSRWKNKWMDMSDEERSEFKEKWKERCSKK